MAQKNIFNIVLLAFFSVLLVLGFASFALFGKLSKKDSALVDIERERYQIDIWGTLPNRVVDPIIRVLNDQEESDYSNITYSQKNSETFIEEYVRAIAVGKGPSLVLLPHEVLLQNQDVLQSVPYTSAIPRSQYESLFISAADIFWKDNGILALPFLTDPLILYYNENIRIKNSIPDIAEYTWEIFTTDDVFKNVIQRTGTSVQQALLPFGTATNYSNVVDVFATLILQAQSIESQKAISDVFSFFGTFANPKSSLYTWNSSLPQAQDMFVSERLLFYIGFASEYEEIQRKNPNLVFRVAVVPQIAKETTRPSTFTRLYAFGLSNRAQVPQVALQVAYDILRSSFVSESREGEVLQKERRQIIELFSIPPAVRDFTPPADAPYYWDVFARSAQIGETWYDKQHAVNKIKIINAIDAFNQGATSAREAAELLPKELVGKE